MMCTPSFLVEVINGQSCRSIDRPLLRAFFMPRPYKMETSSFSEERYKRPLEMSTFSVLNGQFHLAVTKYFWFGDAVKRHCDVGHQYDDLETNAVWRRFANPKVRDKCRM